MSKFNLGSTRSVAVRRTRRWPRTAAIYWRAAFWITLVHFLAFGCLTGIAIKNWRGGPALDINALYQQFGLASSAGLILLAWFWVVWMLLVAADWAALSLFRNLVRGEMRRGRLAAYLLFVSTLLAIHETGMASILLGLKGRGLIWALIGTYAATAAIADLLIAAPAAFLLGGGVLFGWPKMRPPWFCAACGYNLTGNASGVCPECGAACDAASLPGASAARG